MIGRVGIARHLAGRQQSPQFGRAAMAGQEPGPSPFAEHAPRLAVVRQHASQLAGREPRAVEHPLFQRLAVLARRQLGAGSTSTNTLSGRTPRASNRSKQTVCISGPQPGMPKLNTSGASRSSEAASFAACRPSCVRELPNTSPDNRRSPPASRARQAVLAYGIFRVGASGQRQFDRHRQNCLHKHPACRRPGKRPPLVKVIFGRFAHRILLSAPLL